MSLSRNATGREFQREVAWDARGIHAYTLVTVVHMFTKLAIVTRLSAWRGSYVCRVPSLFFALPRRHVAETARGDLL